MDRNYKIFLYLLAFGSGLLLSYFLFSNKVIVKKEPFIEKTVVRDTVLIAPSKPVAIHRAKPRLIKTSDSIIKTTPFQAKVDTIVNFDTIKAVYEYPQNLFSLVLKKKPDSLKVRTIIIYKPLEKEAKWWELPAGIAGGILLGVLVGSAIK
jgi:hypothetical protein